MHRIARQRAGFRVSLLGSLGRANVIAPAYTYTALCETKAQILG